MQQELAKNRKLNSPQKVIVYSVYCCTAARIHRGYCCCVRKFVFCTHTYVQKTYISTNMQVPPRLLLCCGSSGLLGDTLPPPTEAQRTPLYHRATESTQRVVYCCLPWMADDDGAWRIFYAKRCRQTTKKCGQIILLIITTNSLCPTIHAIVRAKSPRFSGR